MKNFFITALILMSCINFTFAQVINHRDSTDVLKYSIHLDLSKLSTKQMIGETDITLKSVFGYNSSIKLDFEGLHTDSVKMGKNKLKFTHNQALLSIYLPAKIAKNDTLTFNIYYQGSPKHDKYWGGFFIDSEFAYNYGIGMEASPPNYGRVWFPCIDNFTDRANYEYFIKTDGNHLAACPGLLQSTEIQNNGLVIYHWKLNQNIPTYLSSVAVGNYEIIKDTVRGLERTIPIELFVKKGQGDAALKTFENVKSFLHAYEFRFGPYLWDKIGYVATPFKQGAMEHATNIAYSSNCVGTTDCESTLAHEFSHHWFGDLVTCRSEQDMWLNEGWARYCEAIYYEYKYGQQAYKNQIRNNHFEVLEFANQYKNSYGALFGMPHKDTYGSVIYNKGGDVAHTLRAQLGDSLFFPALKNYFKEYSFKDVSVKDFESYLSNYTKIDLSSFFDFWIYDKGFPDFSINKYTIDSKKGKYKIDFEIIQRILNTEKFAKSTKLEIGILDKNLKINKYPIVITGESVAQSLNLDYEPLMILIDPDEKISDATCDENMIVSEISEVDFLTENFKLSVNKIEKPTFFSVTQHWIAPLNSKSNNKTHRFANKYWDIQFTSKDSFNSDGFFYLTVDKQIYTDLDISNLEKIRLFYRQNNQAEWKTTNARFNMNEGQGYFSVNKIICGQYAIALIE